MGYIFDDSKKPPKKIRDKWGNTFKNEDLDLPTQTSDGKFIEYNEYKVRPIEGGSENNVHRIVVGSDGKYYYTNTHYGTSKVHKGIPFYEAGKLPTKTIEKIFK
jgi:guanyl-specific ribonuclease Sa